MDIVKEALELHIKRLEENAFNNPPQRVLTKDSISGSEFGNKLYRLWRTRNPDESLEKYKSGEVKSAYDMVNKLKPIIGTGIHQYLYDVDEDKEWAEISFEADIDGVKYTGTADKVIVVGDEFMIADYKTSMSAVIGKVRGIVEGYSDVGYEYFDNYTWQASLYTYLMWHNNQHMKYPTQACLLYLPTSIYAKDKHAVNIGEYFIRVFIDIKSKDEVEERMREIKKVLSSDSEPEFDCVTIGPSKDCLYCTATCEFNG